KRLPAAAPEARRAAPRRVRSKPQRPTKELRIWTSFPRVPLAEYLAVRHLRADEAAHRRSVQHRMELDGHVHAGRKCRRTNAFAAQLVRTAPFEAPFRDLAARVCNVHLYPGMGI